MLQSIVPAPPPTPGFEFFLWAFLDSAQHDLPWLDHLSVNMSALENLKAISFISPYVQEWEMPPTWRLYLPRGTDSD